MHPAVVIGERLARFLLLACTVLGVAALHTVGHAAVSGLDHHDRVSVSARLTVATTSPDVAAGYHGGCEGDGCDHRIVSPGATRGTLRWWDICLAALRVSALGAPTAGTALQPRNAIPWTTGTRHQPPPRAARSVLVGLALTMVVVLRT